MVVAEHPSFNVRQIPLTVSVRGEMLLGKVQTYECSRDWAYLGRMYRVDGEFVLGVFSFDGEFFSFGVIPVGGEDDEVIWLADKLIWYFGLDTQRRWMNERPLGTTESTDDDILWKYNFEDAALIEIAHLTTLSDHRLIVPEAWWSQDAKGQGLTLVRYTRAPGTGLRYVREDELIIGNKVKGRRWIQSIARFIAE